MNPLIQFKNITTLPLCISLTRGCFALSQTTEAGWGPFDTAYGDGALENEDGGSANSAFGCGALHFNTTGTDNTAIGAAALVSNTTGSFNTAIGSEALEKLRTGTGNTAAGAQALLFNKTGSANTATGLLALRSNTTGGSNTATGAQALVNNTTGSFNTAIGNVALVNNSTGTDNTAIGSLALLNNTSGGANTASGEGALYSNQIGFVNTATGAEALFHNTTGAFNTANGVFALFTNTTGNYNIAVGSGAGENLTTGNDNIDIGNVGVAAEASTIRIGTQGTHTRTFVAGISGTGLGSGVAVRVNASGQLGTAPSSVRFKQNIKPMDKASEAIHALKPVTFRYKRELDPEGVPQFGLVAEDVEKVNPDLVACDAEGKPYTVRYEAVNAMLLNEFLKEHRKNQKQEATIAQLKQDFQSTFAQQQKQIEALTAGLEKVNAQLESRKPALQTVLNDQ
jgi:hypothetical protein